LRVYFEANVGSVGLVSNYRRDTIEKFDAGRVETRPKEQVNVEK